MKGYQITFFTNLDRRQDGLPVGEWLIKTAKEMGLQGATLIPAGEGFGHDRRIHSAHFFELADQPVEVIMSLSAEEADQLFATIKASGVKLFYIKTEVEFGVLGE